MSEAGQGATPAGLKIEHQIRTTSTMIILPDRPPVNSTNPPTAPPHHVGALTVGTDRPDDDTRLVTRAELIALGADPAAVDLLPIRHVGPDGEPYWPETEARDLLALLARGGAL